MSIFSSSEDLKKFRRECITCEERKIKYYKREIRERRKLIKKLEKKDGYNRRFLLKSEKDLLEIEKRGLKQCMDYLSEWQKRYALDYGLQYSRGEEMPLKRSLKQKLTIIHGGRPGAEIYGGFLSETGRNFIAALLSETV